MPLHGTELNNKQKVLEAPDVVPAFTWADFGGSNERITSIVYSSASLGLSVTATFAYTLVGSKYRLDSITWS